MKVEYFVVAFGLLFVGAYFTYEKHMNPGSQDSTIVISSDNYYEEIKYAGKIAFNEEETAIESISPGGYINFRKNEERLFVKRNKEGLISYELTEGGEKRALDSNGKKFIADAVKEMIARGINAKERMDRLYRKGGNAALLSELDNLKNDNTQRMYFDQLLRSGSLSSGELAILIKKIGTMLGSDQDKQQVLHNFTPEQLKDSATAQAYLQAVENFTDDNARASALKKIMTTQLIKNTFPQLMHSIEGMHDENEKAGMLKMMIDTNILDKERTNQLLDATDHLNDEMQKENLLLQFFSRKAITPNGYDKMLELISRFRDNSQKENLYKQLIAEKNISEEQWVTLINQTAQTAGDFEKSNFLLLMSQKMPKSENIKIIYLKAAKTITDDGQYGKVVRAVE